MTEITSTTSRLVVLFRRKNKSLSYFEAKFSRGYSQSRNSSLANMPYYSASMATRTQRMCVYGMNLEDCESA